MTTTIRLAGLHLVSRRVPASLLALAGVAVGLRVALRWTPASGVYSVMFPLIMAAAAAAVISATTHSPLGEPERFPGRGCPGSASAAPSSWPVPHAARWPSARSAATWPSARRPCCATWPG